MTINKDEVLTYATWSGQAMAIFTLGAVFASLLRQDLEGVRFFAFFAGACVLLTVGAEVTRLALRRKKATR